MCHRFASIQNIYLKSTMNYPIWLKFIVACLALVFARCTPTLQKDTIGGILDLGQPLPIILTDETAVDTTMLPDSINRNTSRILEYYNDEYYPIVDPQPIPIRVVTPRQPFDSLGSPILGTVWVKSMLDSRGAIRKAIVVKTDNIRLNKPTLRAMMQWQFEKIPYNYAWIAVPFRFRGRK